MSVAVPAEMASQIAGHTLITCNPEQESEATWLAGCLLRPRQFRLNTSGALLQARRSGVTKVSEDSAGPGTAWLSGAPS